MTNQDERTLVLHQASKAKDGAQINWEGQEAQRERYTVRQFRQDLELIKTSRKLFTEPDYQLEMARSLCEETRSVTAPRPEIEQCNGSCRRIVLCFDGTLQKFSEQYSNVLQFFKCLKKDEKLQCLSILNANLEVTDEPGDKISLFGFSRGAYAACVLSGFLQKIGLLPRDNIEQIPFAWNIFKKSDSIRGLYDCKKYRKSFSPRDVKIDFIGLWDTVDSVGISGRELPFAIPIKRGGTRVFRHALSLDERRAKFKPNFKTPFRDEGVGDSEYSYQEVWFAGCHGDVGGGCEEDARCNSLAHVPLQWMIRECFRKETGIVFISDMLNGIGLDVDQLQGKGDRAFFRPDVVPDKGNTLIRVICRNILVRPAQCIWKVVECLLVCLTIRHFYHVIKYTSFCKKIIQITSRFYNWNHHGNDGVEDIDEMGWERELKSQVRHTSERKEEDRDAISHQHDLLSEGWLWPVFWWLFELWPLVVRVQESDDRRRELQTQVNLGRGREIYGDAWNENGKGGQYIEVHRSVFTRMKNYPGGYRPRAWFRFGENGKFRWVGDINKLKMENLKELGGGWDKIRWVGNEEERSHSTTKEVDD